MGHVDVICTMRLGRGCTTVGWQVNLQVSKSPFVVKNRNIGNANANLRSKYEFMH